MAGRRVPNGGPKRNLHNKNLPMDKRQRGKKILHADPKPRPHAQGVPHYKYLLTDLARNFVMYEARGNRTTKEMFDVWMRNDRTDLAGRYFRKTGVEFAPNHIYQRWKKGKNLSESENYPHLFEWALKITKNWR